MKEDELRDLVKQAYKEGWEDAKWEWGRGWESDWKDSTALETLVHTPVEEPSE